MSLSRREFFKTSLVLTGGMMLPRWARADSHSATRPAAMPDVVHVTGENVDAMVRRLVDELGGIGAFVRRGESVVISPNVGFPNPPDAVTTTDPQVVASMIQLCKEAHAGRIVVANYPVRDSDLCFRRSGIRDLREIDGVEVMPLNSRSAYTEVEIPGALEARRVELATIVCESDVLISMPVAKSHSSAGVSFAMKGHMGLIKSRGPFHARYNLHQAIVDLSKLVKPNLVLTDARRALVDNGPGGPGTIVSVGAMVAGANQVSVDAYTVGLTKWYNHSLVAHHIQHLKLANEQGLGEIDVERMNVVRVEV